MTILKNDKDHKKRAEVPFILKHIQNNEELVKLLTPFIRDPHSSVRNNVMRVIAATLAEDLAIDFPVDEAITALDFPRTTDSNKALYILSSLAERKRLSFYIAQHAGRQLIAYLKTTQPILHDNAYTVLRKVSGQKYGERDYRAWQDWLDTLGETSTGE